MNDSIWFYINAQQEKIGPVPASEIAQAYRRGHIRLDGLVWSQGMPQWEALSEHLETFGISTKPADTTKMASGEEVKYAHFIHRWAAHLIDNCLLMTTSLLIIAALALIGFLLTGQPIESMSEDTKAIAIMFAVFGIFLVYPVLSGTYHSLLEGSEKQGSWGKQYLGIVVSTDKGEKVNHTKAFTRWAASFISHMTQSIGFIIAAFTPRRQALHDYIVGTLVVENPREKIERNVRATWAIIICVFLVPMLITAAIAIPVIVFIKKEEAKKREEYAAITQTAAPVKAAVQAQFAKDGTCPDDAEASVLAVIGPFKAKASEVTVGEREDGEVGCEIYASYGNGRYVVYRLDEAMNWAEETELSITPVDESASEAVSEVAASKPEKSATELAQLEADKAAVAAAAGPIKAVVQAQFIKDGTCLTDKDAAVKQVLGPFNEKVTSIVIGETEEADGCEIYADYGENRYLWYRINKDREWSEETEVSGAD